jgi:hypothetical protein
MWFSDRLIFVPLGKRTRYHIASRWRTLFALRNTTNVNWLNSSFNKFFKNAVPVPVFVTIAEKISAPHPLRKTIKPKPMLRIRRVYPGSNFLHPFPGSIVKKIPDPDPHLRIYVFFTLTTVSKHSEKWSVMFILYPDFFPREGEYVSWDRNLTIHDPW